MKEKKKSNINILLMFVICIGIVFVAFCIRRYIKTDSQEPEILTSSTLTDAINISELSTAKFTYNGIAAVYEDEAKENVKCYIYYSASVKAGIDMSEVTFDIDRENMTVKPILPEIRVTFNTIDESSFSFIGNENGLFFVPREPDMEIAEILSVCKEDAFAEASESGELFRTAEENLHSLIEGLLYPILENQGYSLIWS